LQESGGIEGIDRVKRNRVKRNTTLTFYGGVNEIGGNKILLRDGDTKVF
jgi:hypothetical protein